MPLTVWIRDAERMTSPIVHGPPFAAVGRARVGAEAIDNAVAGGSGGPTGPCGPAGPVAALGPAGPLMFHSTSLWLPLQLWPFSVSMNLIDPSVFLHVLSTPFADGVAAYPTPGGERGDEDGDGEDLRELR